MNKIIINIKTNGLLDQDIMDLELEPNTNLIKLIELLKIGQDKIGIITVNGVRVMGDYLLQDKDFVKLISPILGG